MLAEFDLKFVPQKAIKGRAVSDFLAEFPTQDNPEETYDFHDKNLFMTNDDNTLYFDGTSNQKRFGVGAVIASPVGAHIPLSVKPDFEVTNNAVEYVACIMGLEVAASLGVKKLKVYGDSNHIINHISKKWKVRSANLTLYQTHLSAIADQFEDLEFIHLPCGENQFADALSKLASMINIPQHMPTMDITIERREEPIYCSFIGDIEEEDKPAPWFQDILNFKLYGTYPPDTDPR